MEDDRKNANNSYSVPIADKFVLNIKEAAAYFNLGEKKLRWIINEYTEEGFFLKIGNKTLIKRKMFEKFIDGCTEI